MNTARNLLLVCFAFGCVPSAGVAETILFESGTLGPTGISTEDVFNQVVPGSNVNANAFVGVRFQLEVPVVTSQVGGHFVDRDSGENAFFGAIVQLDGANDFPDSGDFTTPDFVGSTLLTFPSPSDEVFGDLTLALEPGWYALVFGSGLFDSMGRGAVVRNGTAIGNPTHIVGSPTTPGVWSDFTAIHRGNRFVLKGRAIPEPTASVLAVIAAIVACCFSRQRVWPTKSS